MNIVLFCAGQPALSKELERAISTKLQLVHDATEHASTADEFIDYLRSTTSRATGASEHDVLITVASKSAGSSYESCARLLKGIGKTGVALPVIVFTDDDPDGEANLLMQGANYCVGSRDLSVRPYVELLDAVLATAVSRSTDVETQYLLTIAGLTFNTNSFKVSSATQHVTLQLTAGEARLLQTLMKHPGHVYSRDRLLTAVWGANAIVDTRTVDSHVKRIRAKLCRTFGPDTGDVISTLYGAGYVMTAETVAKYFPISSGHLPKLSIVS